MPVETVLIRSEADIVAARNAARRHAGIHKFGTLEATRLITAVSEIARNTFIHGGGGEMQILSLTDDARCGLTMVFRDSGPGIPDIEQAMRDGFSTARSLGMGLGGARRLVQEFDIQSMAGNGTTVTLTCWKRL